MTGTTRSCYILYHEQVPIHIARLAANHCFFGRHFLPAAPLYCHAPEIPRRETRDGPPRGNGPWRIVPSICDLGRTGHEQ